MPAKEKVTRKLSAILSADVKGYSILMADDEVHTIETLKAYRKIIADLISKHSGRVVDSPGDNILAEFRSAFDAVECAVKIQKRLDQENLKYADEKKVQFRIGVNVGDVIQDGDRIYGNGVNVAARIEGLAEPGGVCISRNAYDHVSNKLNFGYEYLGEHTVKNIKKPVRAYKLLMADEDAGKLIGDVPKPLVKNWIWATIVVAAVIITSVVILVYQNVSKPEFEPAKVEEMVYQLPEKPSIVVLPFDNMSGEPNQEYFSDGLTEQIITTLSMYPRLFVIARQSAFSYKGKSVKIKKVAEDLGVRYVLKGGVQKSGDTVRITVQLIDTVSGSYIWSERYDRELKNLFDLQDEITISVMNNMVAELTEGEQARRWTQRVTNLNALEKHYKAQGYFCLHTKEGYDKAKPLFEEAIALEPGFVWPYVYLGYLHGRLVLRGWSETPDKSYQIAFELAQKALAIDDSHDGAHSLLAGLYNIKRQYDKALPEAERAVALNPNGFEARMIMASILGNLGRWEESVLYAKKSFRLNPFPGAYLYFILGRAYYMTEQYDESISTWKKALKVSPNFLSAHLFLAACYSSTGRDEEAAAAAKEVLKLNPKFSIESYAKRLTYKKKADIDREVSALRKAGLPYSPPLPLPEKPSIAVLAFDNLSGDPEQEFFSDGISENIITALSKVGELFVIARNSSFTYKDKPVKVQQIGRELGVRYVLEGSVQKSGNRVRITSQLIDANNGQHLWAEKYDRDFKEIFEIQDEITMKIVIALRVKLTEGEQARLWSKNYEGKNINIKAWEKSMQSRWHYFRMNDEGKAMARKLAEEAIEIDPNFPGPYIMLAFINQRNVSLAEKYALKALELNDSEPMAHIAMGQIYLQKRQWGKAIAKGEKAIALDPNGAEYHYHLAYFLQMDGKYEKAILLYEKAIRLNPYPPSFYYNRLGGSYAFVNRYDEAIEMCKKGLRRQASDLYSRFILAAVYIWQGRKEAAQVEASKIIKAWPQCSLGFLKNVLLVRNKEDLNRLIEAWRKAGIPE